MNLEELKKSQAQRASKSFEIDVQEWNTRLKVRRATIADQQKAQEFAKKNFPKKAEIVTGAALICIVCQEGLDLSKENIEFLLNEPAEVLLPIIQEINRLAGIDV